MQPVPQPTSSTRTQVGGTAPSPCAPSCATGRASSSSGAAGTSPSGTTSSPAPPAPSASASAAAAARSASRARSTSAFHGSSVRSRSGLAISGIVRARRSSTSSTSISVSGRGISTPGSQATVSDLKGASPMMYCSGSPLARRTTPSCMKASSSGVRGLSKLVYMPTRSRPVAVPMSQSAETRGCSTPLLAKNSTVHLMHRSIVQVSSAMSAPSSLRWRARLPCHHGRGPIQRECRVI